MNYPDKQQGVALVLVLWVIVLLTVIAGSMAMTQRTSASMVSNVKSERIGRALIEAGINFMAVKLSDVNLPADDNEWPVDGRLHTWEFAGHTIWIGAMPESARINLNKAEGALLLGMLQSIDLDEYQATAIRDAILDWRDRDSDHQLEGAEDDAYRQAGRPVGARDEQFQSVGELQQVLGVTQDLYKKLAPLLTVYSGQRTVNPLYASGGVLSSVPGVTREDVVNYQQLRDEALEQGVPVPDFTAGERQYMANSRGSVYRVFAELELVGGSKVQGEVVLDTGQRKNRGYKILARNYNPLSVLERVVSQQ